MSVPNEKSIDFIEKARADLKQDKIDVCINKMEEGLKTIKNHELTKDWCNQLISMSSIYFRLKGSTSQISFQEQNTELNKVVVALSNLLELIERTILTNNISTYNKKQEYEYIHAELIIAENFDSKSFEEQERYIEKIRKLLRIGAEIKIKRIRSGSIIYELEIKPQTIHKIKSLIKLGLLPKEYESCIAIDDKMEAYYDVLVELGIYDLGGTNLKRADLSKADLRGANLINANLKNTNLVDANLWRTRFHIKDRPQIIAKGIDPDIVIFIDDDSSKKSIRSLMS